MAKRSRCPARNHRVAGSIPAETYIFILIFRLFPFLTGRFKPLNDRFNKINMPEWQHSKECMCRPINIAKCENRESVTSGLKDRQTPSQFDP